MSLYCIKCEKTFGKEDSLRRHMRRKYPCRKQTFTCTCESKFVSKESMRIHQQRYCKVQKVEKELDDIINVLESKSEVEADTSEAIASDVLQELTEISKPETESIDDQESFITGDNNILKDLDGILATWLNDLFQMESLYRQRAITKKSIDDAMQRLLQDGLLTQQDYNDLIYLANLCYRLRELITIPIPRIKKDEIMRILAELLQLHKINMEAYLAICNCI